MFNLFQQNQLRNQRSTHQVSQNRCKFLKIGRKKHLQTCPTTTHMPALPVVLQRICMRCLSNINEITNYVNKIQKFKFQFAFVYKFNFKFIKKQKKNTKNISFFFQSEILQNITRSGKKMFLPFS